MKVKILEGAKNGLDLQCYFDTETFKVVAILSKGVASITKEVRAEFAEADELLAELFKGVEIHNIFGKVE